MTSRPLVALAFASVLFSQACGMRKPEPSLDNSAPPIPADAKALPESAFRVEWISNTIPKSMKAGERVSIQVSFRNPSPETWPDRQLAKEQYGTCAVKLSHQWWDAATGKAASSRDARVELPRPIPSGETVTLTMNVVAPKTPGSYNLQCDLVQEYVSWFDAKGTAKLVVPVTVD